MKKKSRNKHLLKKRRKKMLLNALAEHQAQHPELYEEGRTTTPLLSLCIGDSFFYEGKTYTVADAEVAGYVAVIDDEGNQDWLPSEIAV